jgi:hypothetical protein
MPKIKFYDVKGKKSFMSDKFKLVRKLNKKRVTHFAVADAPSGIKAWRIVKKDFYLRNK